MPFGNFHNLVHTSRLTIQVNGNNCLGLFTNRLLNQANIYVVVVWVDINEDSLSSGVADRKRGGSKRIACGDYFITRSNIQCSQSHVQCFGSVGQANAMLGATIFGKLLFELSHLRTKDKGTRVDDFGNALEHFFTNRP